MTRNVKTLQIYTSSSAVTETMMSRRF